jgi:hypothetical protein
MELVDFAEVIHVCIVCVLLWWSALSIGVVMVFFVSFSNSFFFFFSFE